jgi:twitching motility protein PilJ
MHPSLPLTPDYPPGSPENHLQSPAVTPRAKARHVPVLDNAPPLPPAPSPLPWIGRRPLVFQLQVLGCIVLACLIAAVSMAWLVVRDASHRAAYLAAAGQIRTLTEQIPKATYAAVTNQAEGFQELRDSAQRMSNILDRLHQGGLLDGVEIPPVSGLPRAALDALRAEWTKRQADVQTFTAQERLLMAPPSAADGAASTAPTEQLTQAKLAANRLLREGSLLVKAADNFAQPYALSANTGGIALAITCCILAVCCLLLMAKAIQNDALWRSREAEAQRRQAEAEKNATQGAILQLMNELGDLAEGNLTVRATVTEDITGAIADSVNYTIEELSILVKRINDAAFRLTSACDAAQATSHDLLAASERQSREIQTAGASVLTMARSMNAVSANANELANVARQSLDAADQGAHAVHNSIAGMNDIRGQIQETSKRIKRLGESSQEIGEIVELISDITEQTNVLALNAAIQAASAGEAGRGFAVVAEEVQRLAERSAEATKQIVAIVKAIQSDTQDAVLAMEGSTAGVVDGARLADAAGQALNVISSVSNNLAQLIMGISSDTQKQAEIATQVARSMQEILRVTEKTTEGTKRTAGSIGQLADLAVELKGSVADFKV